MNRYMILIALFIVTGLIPPVVVQAACQVGEGKSVKTTISFVGNPSGSSITVNGTTLSRNAAQCTTPVASGSYTVSCDTRTETLAADSVFAPLCGSAVELGKANSSCWTCGDGSLRCSGSSFALGETDDSIYLNRQPIDGGDTSQVWRVGSHPSTFTYNGVKYTHDGDLVVCTSNVAGCGADPKQTTCTSALYPDVTTQNVASANEVVEVVGDTVHEQIQIPDIFSEWISVPLFSIYRDRLAKFVLDIWPKDDTLQSPNLKWLSNQLYDTNFGPLNPKILQDRTVHMAKLQPYSTTARLCVPKIDKKTNTIEMYTAVSEERYESKTSVPFLLKGIEGSRGLSSKMTRHRELDQNFDDKPTVKVKTNEPLPCETSDVSQNLVKEPVGTVNRNIFGGNTVTGSIPWLSRVLITGADIVESLKNLFRWEKTIPGYILKTHLIRSAELDCYTGHCETADLGRVNYVSASEKQELVSSGGIVETFKPLSHSLPGPIHGGVKNQQFATTNLGDKTAETRIWGLNRTTEAGIYFNCMIEPLSKQAELMPASLYPPTASNPSAKTACSQKWEGEKPPDQPPPMSNFALGSNTSTNGVPPTLGQSGAGSDRRPDGTIRNAYMENIIKQAAQNAQIPACVLEAVGMIEGAYNWGQADNNPAQCVPNRCGAAGPFQITIGHNGDNSDCAKSCSAGYCPNAWDGNQGTPCDISLSAKIAAQKLKNDPVKFGDGSALTNADYNTQLDSIKSAAYHFYGSHDPQSSLPYNGKNLSYEDFVVEHCRLFPQGKP